MSAGAVRVFREKEYIRWLGEYRPEYKYDIRNLSGGMPGVYIYTFGEDTDVRRGELEDYGVTVEAYNSTVGCYVASIGAAECQEVAKDLWWVRGVWRQPKPEVRSLEQVTVNFDPSDSRSLVGAYDTPRSGLGVLVGIKDMGIYKWHDELGDIFHGDSEINYVDDHGTHVTAIVAGRPKLIDGGWDYWDEVKGVVPDAEVLFRDFEDIDDLADLESFWIHSARVSNHSYTFCEDGEVCKYVYDETSTAYDMYCDDKDLVMVVSAGNDPDVYVTNPATAKNVLTVGATHFVSHSASGQMIGDHAPYSVQGPTRDDHRLKPDIVAPGGDASFNRGVVSAYPSSNGIYEFPEWQSDDNYTRSSGTSMAAPHVTGVVVALLEGQPDMSSEMVKAIVINTAIPIRASGDDPLGGYANLKVGYGLVNGLTTPDDYFASELERLLDETGSVSDIGIPESWTVVVPDGVARLAVTLAYNDEEGEESDGDALIDDLDLGLVSPSVDEYWARNHMPLWVGVGSPLEKMIIEDPEEGTWEVRVVLTDSPAFSSPFTSTSQEFAVVVDAIKSLPELELSDLQTTYGVTPGQDFIVDVKVENTGGYIAAGVTVEIEGPPQFGGDINKSRYLGNLVYGGASETADMTLTAPEELGTYTLTAKADAVNKELSVGYPLTEDITVHVCEPIVSAPTNCVVTLDRCDGILVSWDWGGAGQTGFAIKRDGEAVGSVGPDLTSYLDFDCSSGNHDYSICAYNDCGCGPSSNASGYKEDPLSYAPSGCAATTDRCEGILLEWDYFCVGHDGFKISRDSGEFVHVVEDPACRSWLQRRTPQLRHLGL